MCQLHRLQPLGRRMCVCPFVSYIQSTLADGCVCVPLSVTFARAGRLWQTDVCVSLCQLHRLQPVDFGRQMCVCPFVSYISYSRLTLADGYVCVPLVCVLRVFLPPSDYFFLCIFTNCSINVKIQEMRRYRHWRIC